MEHKAAGVITEVAPAVTNGKRVTGLRSTPRYIRLMTGTYIGDITISATTEKCWVSSGNYKKHGAFAELVSVPAHILYKIPNNISFEQGTIVEPVAIVLHAVNVSGIQIKQNAVVIGTGTKGSRNK